MHTDPTDPQHLLHVLQELGIAALAGLLGALVRVTARGDRRLTPVALVDLMGGLALGTGGWSLALAAGLDGWPVLAVAWSVGALGYAVLHDLLLHIARAKFGLPTPPGPPS